jgi:hypothetical protein
MRNPFRSRRDAKSWNAAKPHPFQEGRDAGLAAFASGGNLGRGRAGNVDQLAMTSAYLRTEHCAVPGCGKPRGDDIHAPEE